MPGSKRHSGNRMEDPGRQELLLGETDQNAAAWWFELQVFGAWSNSLSFESMLCSNTRDVSQVKRAAPKRPSPVPWQSLSHVWGKLNFTRSQGLHRGTDCSGRRRNEDLSAHSGNVKRFKISRSDHGLGDKTLVPLERKDQAHSDTGSRLSTTEALSTAGAVIW